jgi:hypothetical protein
MINYITTSQIHSGTWEIQEINLQIDEAQISNLESLEGNFQAKTDFINQGIAEGWIVLGQG